MTRNTVIFLFFLFVSCNEEKRFTGNPTLYLTNHSFDEFDKAFFKVFANDELILSDSVRNRYLSFHWKDSMVNVPDSDFKLKVLINSNGFEVEKDTLVSYKDNLRIFVTFDFYPKYKRYTNPEIFKHFSGETTRLTEIADSLYSIKALSNANEFLNDTIPLKSSLLVNFK